MKVKILQGDITRIGAHAIVNAANVTLLGGGGVDGAIHRAAGPKLKEACREFPLVEVFSIGDVPCEEPGDTPVSGYAHVRCPVGEARLTKGFNLPALNIIHTVGPMWFDNPRCRPIAFQGEGSQQGNPRDLLAKSIRACLELAEDNDLPTIAFPAISCGVFGGSIAVFAKVAHEVLNSSPWDKIKTVAFVLYQPDEYEAFRLTWDMLQGDEP